MADERKGAYAEVEGLKKSKHKIGKDYKRIEILISLTASFMFMIIFTQTLFSIDIIFLPIVEKPQGDFNKFWFLVSITIIMIYVFLFISKKNRVKAFKPDLERIEKLTKIKNVEKISLFSFSAINRELFLLKTKKIIYNILSFPYTLISKVVYIPDDLSKSLGFEAGYLSKLEKNFFYQVVEKEDGYLRVEVSDILKDKKKIFACENDEELENIKKLFKNDAAFEDLFLIIEGYLTKSKLFDTALKDKDDISEQEYRFFQSYMLRVKKDEQKPKEVKKDKKGHFFSSSKKNDEVEKVEVKPKEKLEHDVTFSVNAINYFIKDKKQKIKKLIEENLNPNLSNESKKTITGRTKLLFMDIHYRKKLINYLENSKKSNKNALIKLYTDVFKKIDKYSSLNELISEIRKDEKLAEQYEKLMSVFYEHLKEILLLDFSIVLFRLVISQYMNLPAGTIVSKLESYDTRMIIEYYKTFSLIEIEDKKNDGLSENFNSDNYVNVFMQFWAKAVDEIDIYQELYFRFNTNENIKPMTQQELETLITSIGLKNAEKQILEQTKTPQLDEKYDKTIIEKASTEKGERKIKDDVFVEENGIENNL